MPRYNDDSANAVPVAPLAKAVIESDMTFSEIAMECGWTRKKRTGSDLVVGDATRLKRRLGLATYSAHGISGLRQEFTSYENAIRIAAAIQRDPVDLGL